MIMKKLSLMILALVLGTTAFGQKFVPTINGNSVISYTFTQNDGQPIPLTLTITSLGAPTKMDWSIDGYGNGSYEMSAKALESGKGMSIATPQPDILTKLPDYKTVACISKEAFNNLVKTQAFEYDDLKYSVTKTDVSLMLNDKPLDVFHAVATNGKGELWILNNPDFPLICKTKDNAQGVDLNLVSVK